MQDDELVRDAAIRAYDRAMKLKFGAAAAVLAAGTLLVGCGSTANTPSASSSAGSSATETTSVPRFIPKRVGEPAGWNCPPDQPSSQCSLQFSITSLARIGDATCADAHNSSNPKPGTVYRVTMDVQGQKPTPPPNGHIQPGYVVTSQYWYALGPDGYTSKAETAIGCGNYTPGAFYDYTAVGEKSRGEILYAVPEGSSKLRLKNDSGGGWEWDLPR